MTDLVAAGSWNAEGTLFFDGENVWVRRRNHDELEGYLDSTTGHLIFCRIPFSDVQTR